MVPRICTEDKVCSRHLLRPCQSQYSGQRLFKRTCHNRNSGLQVRRYRLNLTSRSNSTGNSSSNSSRSCSRSTALNLKRTSKSHLNALLPSRIRHQNQSRPLQSSKRLYNRLHRSNLRSQNLIQRSSSHDPNHTSSLLLQRPRTPKYPRKRYQPISTLCFYQQQTSTLPQRVVWGRS